jgi:hypothetical protein
VNYVEKLSYSFDVEANSPEEAKRYFEENSDEFDFSDGHLDDSGVLSVEWTDENGKANEMICN